MIKINLIKNKIINYNYINFITFIHYKVAIFHNNKPNFIIISFIININKKINKTTIINITNNKHIFIIVYFIINNTINKTTNLKRKLIIYKILIFIINKSIEHNLIFNIIFNNITFYKVDTFNNNILISPIIIIFTISSNTIKINITFINFTTNLATKLNTNFSNITSYKVALSHNNKHKFNIIFKSSNNKIIT